MQFFWGVCVCSPTPKIHITNRALLSVCTSEAPHAVYALFLCSIYMRQAGLGGGGGTTLQALLPVRQSVGLSSPCLDMGEIRRRLICARTRPPYQVIPFVEAAGLPLFCGQLLPMHPPYRCTCKSGTWPCLNKPLKLSAEVFILIVLHSHRFH